MDYSILSGVAGIILAIIIYYFQEKRRTAAEKETRLFQRRFTDLEERNRADAWHLYRTAFLIWAKLEQLKVDLDNSNYESNASGMQSEIGTVYGLAIEHTREAIKLIKYSESDFEKSIVLWRRQGKIPNDYQRDQFIIIAKS
jgi:hypothetical protein